MRCNKNASSLPTPSNHYPPHLPSKCYMPQPKCATTLSGLLRPCLRSYFSGFASALCQPHLFLPRRNRSLLLDWRPHIGSPLSTNLPLRTEIQRGPTPRQQRQTRARRPDQGQPLASQPFGLLPPPTYRLLRKLLQRTFPRFCLDPLTLGTFRVASGNNTLCLAVPSPPCPRDLPSSRFQVDIALPQRGRFRR
jgi:hypothetical protein